MPPQDLEIKQQVRERFARIAQSPESEKVFPVGSDSAKALGYDADEIDNLPVEVTESFSGVGNPLSLGSVALGQTVLDLACGHCIPLRLIQHLSSHVDADGFACWPHMPGSEDAIQPSTAAEI